jgi:hypothetical protein
MFTSKFISLSKYHDMRKCVRNSGARWRLVVSSGQNFHRYPLAEMTKELLWTLQWNLIPEVTKGNKTLTTHFFARRLSENERKTVLPHTTVLRKLLFILVTRLTRNWMVVFEVLTAVVMESSIFRDITPRSPLKVNRCFEGICCLPLQVTRKSQAWKKSERRWQVKLSSAGFLLGLFFDPWRWRRHVPP